MLEQPPPLGSGPKRVPSTAEQQKPSKPQLPATKALYTPPGITRKKPTPHGASNHQLTNLASAQTSQRSPRPSPPWPSKLGRHHNEHRPSSKNRRHATTRHLHTSENAPSIHPYQTPTSLPTMRGPSTSSCSTTPHLKQGTRQHASPNNSPAPHYTKTYKHLTSSSPTARATTITTATPRMSAPPLQYTPSARTLAASRHGTTRDGNGSIRYTSSRPHATGPPTTRPLPPTALPSTQLTDESRHNTKTAYSHASALDPDLSPRSPTKVP